MKTIENITFEIREYGVEFDFNGGSAILQLPTTGDSIDAINGNNYDDEDASHAEIYAALKKHFYKSFKNSACAAAAACLLDSTVYDVIETDICHVAFTENGQFCIVMSSYANYYSLNYLFEKVQHWHNINEKLEIEKAVAINCAKTE